MMKYTIRGTPVTKKNSARIILARGKPRIIPSKQFVEYEKAALYQLMPVRPHSAVDHPVNVKCVYYMPTNRRVDLDQPAGGDPGYPGGCPYPGG